MKGLKIRKRVVALPTRTWCEARMGASRHAGSHGGTVHLVQTGVVVRYPEWHHRYHGHKFPDAGLKYLTLDGHSHGCVVGYEQ